MKKLAVVAMGLAVLMVGVLVGGTPSTAADHLEAPDVAQDGRTDIADIYAFASPDYPDRTVLIMTVNPGAGVLSPTEFDRRATYQFRIDNDQDAKQEEAIKIRFGRVQEDGSQSVKILGSARGNGSTGEVIDLKNGGRAYAGTFDDPFFFDLVAFQDQVKGAGGTRAFCDGDEHDFFAGLNVSAIVLEVPTDSLTDDNSMLGVWAETRRSSQRDRMGRPAIATVLIDDGMEKRFNRTSPHRDLSKFGDQVKANLLFLSGVDGTGYTDEEAQGVTEVILPDILTYDTSAPASYLNGRGLADDVIDLSLVVVTGGLGSNGTPVLDSDCVPANDVAFPGTFPFLAPAHP